MDFLTDVRMKVRQAVETLYGFDADNMNNNAARARQLLSNNAFIHRVRPIILSFAVHQFLYAHRNPILAKNFNIPIQIPSSKRQSISYGSRTGKRTALLSRNISPQYRSEPWRLYLRW